MKLWVHCNNFFNSLAVDNSRQIDMLCLKNATERFLKSGTKDDAFDVYYCFSEIFKIFGDGYEGATVTLLDILADYEANAGAVLAKHRDHYSHSVYDFALGLAFYQINRDYQKIFNDFYKEKKYKPNEEYLYRWGMASLFHDVGYPFEVAFKSMQAYTHALFGKFTPQLMFDVTAFIENDKSISKDIAPRKEKLFTCKDCHELLSAEISECFGFDFQDVKKRIGEIAKNKQYADHAYYGAIIILKKLLEKGKTKELAIYTDTAMTVLLHSSFWRRNLAAIDADGTRREKPILLTPKMHPLVFMLNFCDELQIFDRIGYGHYSKDEPLPRTAYFDILGSELTIVYSFGDEALNFKNSEGTVDASFINKIREKVLNDVSGVVSLSDFMDIKIDVVINNWKKANLHKSTSFFRYILEIAQEIHRKYVKGGNPEYNDLLIAWDKLSLEKKMSNIAAAKSYADKLAMCNYFYDDKVLGFCQVSQLSPEQIEGLARKEHDRWCEEAVSMGWDYEDYDVKDKEVYKQKRSVERKHNCLKPYDQLDEHYKNRDADIAIEMINNLTAKRKGKTGLYVYDGNIAKRDKKPFYIGITGHRDKKIALFSIEKLAKELMSTFVKINKEYGDSVVVLNSLADGFDLLAAKIAIEFDWTIKATLPIEIDKYYAGIKDKLTFDDIRSYERYTELLLPRLFENCYEDTSRYIASNCDMLVCAWGGKESVNLGGTYYT